MEGCYLLPQYVKEIKDEYPEQNLSVFIVFSTQYIKENFETKILEHRHAAEIRNYQEDRPISQFIKEHEDVIKSCEASGVEYFKIHNDYEEEILKIQHDLSYMESFPEVK